MPLVQGRGGGLGNELIPWARAYLMAQVLGARCLAPAFGLNRRNYRQHFGTSRLDFAWHRLITSALPRVHFDEAAFEAHGGVDTVEAFTHFAHTHRLFDRSPVLVTTDGMWGSFNHIAKARDFVRATLGATRYARHNLGLLGARLNPDKLTVALHVRLGDFESEDANPDIYRGQFNCALPLRWFLAVSRQLQVTWGPQLQFQIFSDGTPAQLAPLVQQLGPVETRCPYPSDVSDLLAMAQADLLVCSVSSYSMWAAALSNAPYLWFAPQMHQHDLSWGSLWGDQPSQQTQNSPTLTAWAAQTGGASARPAGRAYAVAMDGQLPAELVKALQMRINERNRNGDLVRCGVARLPGSAGY